MPEGEKEKVLIVEDEPAICDLCKRILTDNGYEVDVVNDGKAAEESVAKQDYNLLLLDIRLPEESGIELYIWLQQEHPESSKRVIFMTGSVMGGEAVIFLERSGRPYLLKPFRPDDLMDKVKEVMN